MNINKELEIRRIIREMFECQKEGEASNSQRANLKKVLLEQAELLENFNKKYPEKVEDLRKNTETLIQIYSYILNL